MKPMNRSLGHVQVGYSGTWEMRPVGSVIFPTTEIQASCLGRDVRIVDCY